MHIQAKGMQHEERSMNMHVPAPEQRMIDVYLHGPMSEAYGHHHRFAITTPHEAILALQGNFPTFRRDFLKVERWALIADGETMDSAEAWRLPVGSDIHIIPQIDGEFAVAGAIVLWLLPAIGVTAANIIGGLLVTGLLIGASMLLSPKPKKASTATTAAAAGANKQTNYSFSGPENVTVQGVSVPCVYGRAWVGSIVISASIDTTDY
jgi:predicted phage tail protein